MYRFIMVLGIFALANGCMTEADRMIWSEFKEEIKKKEGAEAPAAPAAESAPSAEQKAAEAAFAEKLNSH